MKIQKGELDANAAFMQGRMKVAGNMGKFMHLLPLTNSPEYQALQAELREVAELLTPAPVSRRVAARGARGSRCASTPARSSRCANAAS